MRVVAGDRSRWVVLGRVVLFLGLCALVLMVAAPVCARLPGLWSQVVLGLVASTATYAVTRLFLRWDELRAEDVGVAVRERSLLRMVAGFGLGLLLVGAPTLMVRAAGHVAWVRMEGISWRHVMVALMGYVALAAREEMAFRGYPLRRLEGTFGIWVAQILVAAVFALEHVAGGNSWKNAVLGAAVGSLLFGMAAMATRGLAVPIGVHAAWNFGQWVLGKKETVGVWRPVVAPGYRGVVDHVGMIAYVVVFGLSMVGFWWVGWRQARGRS
jgi:membrane protease YdiL (CAAX protease family)